MRLFGIIALSIWLFSSGVTQQFWKLPELLQHFQEHQAFQTNLSFSDFLYMHYVGSDNDGSDDKKDASLPFKTHEENQVSQEIISNQLLVAPIEIFGESLGSSSFMLQNENSTSRSCGSVFRPPLT